MVKVTTFPSQFSDADVNFVVVLKNPADFIGSALGESEKNTKGILANTIGKVLVIDEVGSFYTVYLVTYSFAGLYALRRSVRWNWGELG